MKILRNTLLILNEYLQPTWAIKDFNLMLFYCGKACHS